MGLRHLKLGDRNRVIAEFYEANIHHGKLYTVEHFMEHYDMNKRTIYRALERIDRIRGGGREGRGETLDRRRNPGSGRP